MKIRSMTALVFILTFHCIPLQAQILLSPQATGSAGKHSYCFYGFPETSSYFYFNPEINLRGSINYYGSFSYLRFTHGIIEFHIDQTSAGGPFPTKSMTMSNWTAKLCCLSVVDPYDPGQQLYLKLFDLDDCDEDGIINFDDVHRPYGDPISTLFSEVPQAGAVLPEVDITDQLRRDLFGDGAGNITSGFYLRSSLTQEGSASLSLDRTSPRIRIAVGTTATPPTPTSTPVASSTPAVTPSPEPTATCNELGVKVFMPGHQYSGGNTCACSVACCNPGPDTYSGIPLLVVLDIGTDYLFAPSFSGVDYYRVDLPIGIQQVPVVDPFEWPDDCGTGPELTWYAGMTNETLTELLGKMDQWSFTWGP